MLCSQIIYFYSSSHPHRKANASLLIAAWSLIYLHRTPDEAIRPFRHIISTVQPFHDASPCICTYNLTVLDCLRGLDKAQQHKFFDFARFNIAAYEHYEQVSTA
jgi:cell division cycle 14